MKLVAFDLDGTLAVSKQTISKDIAKMLELLTEKYIVAIISGGGFNWFKVQLFTELDLPEKNKKNFYMMPSCGTEIYKFQNEDIEKIYSDKISPEDRKRIIKVVDNYFKNSKYFPKENYGDFIEERGEGQITIACLGQHAPIEIKSKWDFDRKKRLEMISDLEKLLPEFGFKTGGTTSIDITKKGIDKSVGMTKLMEVTGVEKKDIFFVGDMMSKGGNDYPVMEMGIKSIETSGPENTREIIKKYLDI
ncbi:HAD family hydrolase [Candidatus Gracilibacteria bacterium]|nr:MAG: HAD family hydrolase [Candidatus Gracilibacteria bacterium]PIE84943.1 MAG: HAD family hydrolase [Candidatus Gracilibacteria bacterium]